MSIDPKLVVNGSPNSTGPSTVPRYLHDMSVYTQLIMDSLSSDSSFTSLIQSSLGSSPVPGFEDWWDHNEPAYSWTEDRSAAASPSIAAADSKCNTNESQDTDISSSCVSPVPALPALTTVPKTRPISMPVPQAAAIWKAELSPRPRRRSSWSSGTKVILSYNQYKLIDAIRSTVAPFDELIQDPQYFKSDISFDPAPLDLHKNKLQEKLGNVYYGRLNLHQMARILNLHNFKLSLTSQIESDVLKVFDRYCVNFQLGVKSYTKIDNLEGAIHLLFRILGPVYPFTKEKLGIMVKRGVSKRLQNNLRSRRRAHAGGSF